MNPSRSQKTMFVSLGLAWLLFAILLAVLLISSWGMYWKSALLLSVVLSTFAQGMVWSSRYACRMYPIAKTSLLQLFLTHNAEAVVLSLIWITIGRFLASWMESAFAWQATFLIYSRLKYQLFGLGFGYYLVGVAFNYALIAQAQSSLAEQRALESSVRARDAELSALKAQINPHFLYNSLNSISALTSIDPARAREMCILLADFLRMTLGLGEKTLIPLQEELDLLDRYCAIERVRFGERLKVELNVEEEARKCLLPPLLLQPLFENAVVHGIAQMAEGGCVRLDASRRGGRLTMIVENSWDPEAVSGRKKNGMGLKNVQRRLEARYGKDAITDAKTVENVFRVSLSLPAETLEAP